jgi:site-specific DNA-methyltransferase (adenine-specific)
VSYLRKEVIGDCELYLGDSIDVISVVGNYDVVLTDPPYGMAFQSNHRKERHLPISNDENADLLHWACSLTPNHSSYIFCRWDNIGEVPKPKSCITWVKNNWSMGDLEHEHARQTEVALFYPGPGHFFPVGRPSDVLERPRTGNSYHPTEKPVDLMAAFLNWTVGKVFDPFMGSGSTGVACAKAGRHFVGVEIEPKYFDIACKRIAEAYAQPDMFACIDHGKKPVDDSNGVKSLVH